MNHRTEIGKRIKKLRQENNYSQTHVASILFISQAAYSLIENSQNGIVVDHIIKLSQLYGVTCDFILRGERNLIKVSRDSGFIPLIRAHAHAGFLSNLGNEDFFDIKDWFRIPGFDPTRDQTLFEVDGDSMSPTIFPGDVLICQVHNHVDQVLDGSAVVIITVEGVMVKRLRIDDNREFVAVENDNPEYSPEPRRLKKGDIKKIMMIRGKISSVLVPHHEITSKGKMRELEESVNMLKKELFSMSKKLNALTKRN
ncbi:transcriptional regulator [Christiangramia fulva]|uniref:Transcriptional regulator n=1 Tax=Christiangramia fulva TaxID=2126553 RepID=A0A2R3Z0Z4_9FLAO|nr:S24 family peptidase [Christiangramia fulva]AVR43931.1 transcriptional regulator [Christiangramia fulva]